MSSRKAGYLALGAVLLIAGAQIGYHWPQLPPRVASHFDFQGNANHWAAKTPVVLSEAGVLLGIAGMQVLLDLLIRYLPPEFFNLPNKEYWVAPEHRAETKRIISGHTVWIFAATALFILAVFELGYLVSLGYPEAMRQGMPWLFAVYAGFMVVCLIRLSQKFSRQPPSG